MEQEIESMKKILILGIKGMAGHVMFNKLSANVNFDVYGIARNVSEKGMVFNIDVTDTLALKEIVNKDFDVIINCIGILNKDAEDNPSKAIWFNSYFPHFLEEITKNTKTKVVHISTDCVFSGSRGNYTETDFKDGIGYYAQSKALGELDNEKDITIRTSIIGPELNNKGIGLFHWFMSQPDNAGLKGYSNAFWSGITTIELANVIETLILSEISGILVVAVNPKIDKYTLLKLCNKIFREDKLNIEADNAYKVDKSMNSIRKDFHYKDLDYVTMLNEMKDYISLNSDAYPHYNLS